MARLSAHRGRPSAVLGAAHASPGQADRFWTPERIDEALAHPLDTPSVGAAQETTAAPGPALPDVATSAPGVAPKGLSPRTAEANTLAAAAELTSSLPAAQPDRWPWRATGILFIQTAGGGYGHCSAAVVAHSNKSSVWTAAHCLYDREAGAFNTGYAFAPGFDNGAPYGYWDVKNVIVPSAYIDEGDYRYSVMGAVVLHQHSGYGYVQDTVGAYGYEFTSNAPENDNVFSIGHPADGYGRADSFYQDGMDGMYMRYCHGNTVDASNFNPLDQRLEMDCEMGHGASGGPLVKDLATDARIVGANSHRSTDDAGNWADNHLYSSEHGAYAVSVYNAL